MMILPYATGFILGVGITLGISFLYFQYKIIPYQRSINGLINLTKENFNKQSMIVRKQEVLIEEMKRYIDNKEDFKNSLGKN